MQATALLHEDEKLINDRQGGDPRHARHEQQREGQCAHANQFPQWRWRTRREWLRVLSKKTATVNYLLVSTGGSLISSGGQPCGCGCNGRLAMPPTNSR